MMPRIRIENIVKNVILLAVLVPFYTSIRDFLSTSEAATDKGLAGNLLIIVSIVAVTACFGNFAFTYERVAAHNFLQRILAHMTTGLLMFIIGLALEMSAVLSHLLIGNFAALEFCWLSLYVGSVLFDFWDLERIGLPKN